MADVFISYAREDKVRADQVALALQQQGYDVFWDSVIPPGQTWSDFIEAKLAACKAVIVLWSETSTKSQWVREEARLGRDRGKLIPARIDSSIAPFGFGEVQTADLSTWTGDPAHPEWTRLIDALRHALNAAPVSPPPQPPPHGQTQSGWSTPPIGGQPGSLPPTAHGDTGQAQLIYILYLASILVGVTAIIGLVMSYVTKEREPDWLKTHHIFLIHTFWIGLLGGFVGILLSVVGIGLLILLALLVWWIVRCVQGLDYLNKREPIPAPRSWLFAK